MSLKRCPVQSICQNFKTGDNKPKNNDVRNKYVCKEYIKGCKDALYVETEIMGLTVACKVKKEKANA